MRLSRGSRLVIATHNEGKVRELRALLQPFGLELVSAKELGLPEPVEDGTTFMENARIKADSAAQRSGLPALADDSGLCVFDLWGAPGIFSARWAGETKDFGAAMQRIHDELSLRTVGFASKPKGAFIAALCLSFPDGRRVEVEGACHGHLVWPPRGDKGFGYDPVFQPEGHAVTFGEMEADTKHGVNWQTQDGLSHRARAFLSLARQAFEKV